MCPAPDRRAGFLGESHIRNNYHILVISVEGGVPSPPISRASLEASILVTQFDLLSSLASLTSAILDSLLLRVCSCKFWGANAGNVSGRSILISFYVYSVTTV